MRRASAVDGNQAQVVAALRKVGATVQSLATVGKGTPDLLVGYRGVNYLLEVKDGSRVPSERRLTEPESYWHSRWLGVVRVVESVEEALKAIGATR